MSIRQLVNDNSINKNKLVHTKHGWMTYSSLALAGIALPVIGMIQKANADTVSSVNNVAVSQANKQNTNASSVSSQNDKQTDSLANDNSVKINAEYASINNENASIKSTTDNKTNDLSQSKSVTKQVTQPKAGDVTAEKATSNNNGVSPKKVEVKSPAVQSAAKSLAQSSSEDVAPAKKVDKVVTNSLSGSTNKAVVNDKESSLKQSATKSSAASDNKSLSSDVVIPSTKNNDIDKPAKIAKMNLSSTNLVAINNTDDAIAAAATEKHNYSFAANKIEMTGNGVKPDTANPTPVDNIVVTINYQENGKTIKTASQTVKNGANVNVQTDCPSGYNVKSGWSVSNMPVMNGKATLNVPVVKASNTVDGSSATTSEASSIKATINYVFNGQTVASQVVTVPNGANIDVSKGVPSGYQIQKGWNSGEIKSVDGKATIDVPLVKAQSSSDDGTVAVTINYKDGSDVIKSVVQNVKSGASVDLNAGVPQGYEITPGFKPESINNITDGKATMNVPVQKINNSAKPVTPSEAKPSDNNVETTINYQYNGKTIASNQLSVPSGANIDVSKGVPSGYQIQKGWETGKIEVKDGKATINVPLVKVQDASTSDTVAVTINYKDGANVIKSVVQNVKNNGNVDLTSGLPAGYEIAPGFKPESINNITDGKATMDVPVQKISDSTKPSTPSETKPSDSTKPTTPSESKPNDSTKPSTPSESKPSTSDETKPSTPSESKPSDSTKPSTSDETKPSTSDDGTGSVGDSGSAADKVTQPAGTGSTTTNGTNKPSEGTQQANGAPADVAKPSDSSDSSSTSKPSISGSTSSADDKTTSSSTNNKDDNQGSTTKHDSVAPDDGNGTVGDNGSNKNQVITPAGTGSTTTNGTDKPSVGTQTAGSDNPSATNPDATDNTNTSSTTSEPQGTNSDDSKQPGSLNSNNSDVSKVNGSETDESKPSEQPSLTVPKDKNDATNADIYPDEGIIPGSNGQQVSSLNGMTPYKDDTKDNSNSNSQVGSANKDNTKENNELSQSGNAKTNTGVVNSQPTNTQSASNEQLVASPSMVSEVNAASQVGSVAKQSSQIGSASSNDELPQTGDKESALVELGLLAASMIGLSAMGIEKKYE